MPDESLIARLREAAHTDATVYAALAQFERGAATFEEALVGCVLVLSTQLKQANQMLEELTPRNPRWAWPGPPHGYIAPGGDMETD